MSESAISDNLISVARERILRPAGLDEADLQKTLDGIMGRAVDAADLYFQLSRHESWTLEDGIVRDAGYGIDQGVGVRAISGEQTGFAYSDEIRLPALEEASRAARAIARSGSSGSIQAWRQMPAESLYAPIDPLSTLDDGRKVELLEAVDAAARAVDPRVKQVIVTLAAVHEVVLVAAADGTFSADVRPLVRLNASVIAEQDGRREQGYSGGGGRTGYSWLLDAAHCISA